MPIPLPGRSLVATALLLFAACSFDASGLAEPAADASPPTAPEVDAAPSAAIDAGVQAPQDDAGPPPQLALCPVEACGNACNLSCTTTDCVCNFDCQAAADTCTTRCDGDEQCQVNCQASRECYPRCTGNSSCEIDCRANADECLARCEGQARCLIQCDGAVGACRFESCPSGEVSCPDDVVVCNRECPS